MKTLMLTAGALALGAATGAGATTIGPDSYGYVATDQVTYTFNDITATGTKVLVDTDDNYFTVTLPFAFNFYGTGYTTAYLTSNGEILFGGGSGDYHNGDLTTGGASGAPGIYTFWDDLYTRTSSNADAGVYYQTLGTTPGSRKFVVQEIANQYGQGSSTSINFQTVLDEATGDILMRYTQTAFGNTAYDNGKSATVGIQGNFAAGQTVEWSYNQPVLRDNESLCFTRNANAACNAIVDQPTPSVPEPASWALMIAGFGATGAVLRRSRATLRLAVA